MRRRTPEPEAPPQIHFQTEGLTEVASASGGVLKINSLLSGVFKRLGGGQLLLRYFYHPKAYCSWLISQGAEGAVRSLRGEAQMMRAAKQLLPISPRPGQNCFEASFMTGRRFWHQTAFCAHSLAGQLGGGAKFAFYDDGSLSAEHVETLRRLFPNAVVHGAGETYAQLEQHLPVSKFPLLHEVRDHSVMFRKLFDLRGGNRGWQLYLDSDMLFFARPVFLEECARRRRACYMKDAVFGYCMDSGEMTRLAGLPIPRNVNAGIVGLDNDLIDWERVENWLGQIPRAIRMNRLFEQTLTAMILSRFAPVPAPEEDYVIVCDPASAPPEKATLLHYIQHSKWLYLSREWRRYLGARTPVTRPA